MERPTVVCHMLSSLNGKIDGDFMGMPETAQSLQEYGRLRGIYQCQATLYGTITMKEGYAEGIVSSLDKAQEVCLKEDFISHADFGNFIVSIDMEGTLAYQSNRIKKKGRRQAHVIAVLSEQVSNDYLAYLRGLDISYLFAGEKLLDCELLLKKLKAKFNIDRLMIAGGGIINRSFLQQKLIDELSLVISPTVDSCSNTVSVFEMAPFIEENTLSAFELIDLRKLEGNTVWLRYALKKGKKRGI